MNTAVKKHRVISPRNTELGWIHQAKTKLQMADADYRQMLWTQAKVHSSKDLDAGGRKRVLVYLASLQPTPTKSATKPVPPKSPLERKFWALWFKLESDGKVDVPASKQARTQAVRAFIKRQAGVDSLSFCSNDQLQALVEALKKWGGR